MHPFRENIVNKVNAAKSRHFQLDVGGPRFTTIGGDGGLQEYPVETETLILAAGERADVIVTPRGAPGSELLVQTIPFNRGYGSIEYRSLEDLFTIADLSTVWVEVNVYAKDVNAVKLGQDVTIKAESIDTTATGKIIHVGSLVSEETRSAKARVVLPDAERKWRAGTFVTVTVVQEEYTAPVAVKREGLQKFRDWDVVFVRSGNTFEARPLELGRTDGEWVEVTSGLSPGEKYASANSFILKADVGKSGASHDH